MAIQYDLYYLYHIYHFPLPPPPPPRHLPMVIQGMENSLGDVHFIRKLHAKCEQESGLVLKRYMKYRHIKMTMSNMKNANNNVKQILPSEIHVILDELALLIQYCCMYAKYLKRLTDGAEKRKRSGGVSALGLPVIPEGTSRCLLCVYLRL